jgi:uncharacterized protein
LTIELKTVGTRCNLSCQYCYLDRREQTVEPDLEKMIAAAKALGPQFSLFGGEPLLTPLPVLEKLFQAGCTGMQTNGTLITDAHIALFKKYRVGIGISLDGNLAANALRADRETTERVWDTIEALHQAGVAVSIISVMHQLNAAGEAIEKFKEFGLWLQSKGVVHVNCHFLQGDCMGALSDEEERDAFLSLAAWLRDHPELRWQPFDDIARLLMGKSEGTLCLWRGCDPCNTSAVQSIEPDGSVTNCGRLVGLGTNWLKPDKTGRQRQDILAATPYEQGGCKGCRFLPLCTGACPGEAIDGDWRNRTSHCVTIKALFRFYEDALLDQGIVPASIKGAVQMAAEPSSGHGDTCHGDSPHMDGHGDHYDSERR